MVATNVERLYEHHIQPLPLGEQCRLIELIARKMAQANGTSLPQKHSIMELHGLGAEIWKGIDAQEYVNELRKEWDHRP
jgi:hypothetical protein